jgi:predicted CoA-binding protein
MKNFYYNTYGYYNYIHSIIKKNVKFQWLQRGVYNINNEQKKNAFMKK